MTVPLFGGRRAIRVRAGSRNFAGGSKSGRFMNVGNGNIWDGGTVIRR
jgi:DNA polymerase-3 subunit delta